jgi:hypothetical protein
MPITPPPNGTFEVVAGGRDGNGNFALNRWIYVAAVAPTDATSAFNQAKELVVGWQAANLTLLLAIMGTDCSINVLYARHIGTLGGSAAYVHVDSVGTGTSESGANVVAADLAWLPGGSSNRPGHTFLWGLPNIEVIKSALSDLLVIAIEAFATQMLSSVVGAISNYALAVLSRKAAVTTVVTASNTRPKITGLNKRTSPFI